MDQDRDVETIAQNVRFGEGFNGKLIEYRYETFQSAFKGESCLELGCGDGEMTKYLLDDFEHVTALDAAKAYCEIVSDLESDSLKVVNSTVEEFIPDQEFDTIILAHLLEHVEEPVSLLTEVSDWLSPNGRIIISVPNANSIHRQAGVEMGLLESIYELNDRDHEIGHKRVYDWRTFRADIEDSGLSVINQGGVFLKPLTNGQIEEFFDEGMQDAFFRLGQMYPKISAELYSVAAVNG
jgi:2-polyprenyl-3-methyl-5-hydroxy-6-metoxy-1,4-benzoquinol methylase